MAMPTYGDLATVATAVDAAMMTLEQKRAAVLAKEPEVLALLKLEKERVDAAVAAHDAAGAAARESTGWNAAQAEFEVARAAYDTARANFNDVVSKLDPLD